ncbi:CgeB family protein [Halalkalibacter oceani]|uniref:Glycosyltransferase n=1 Tax=Halalkalibacter oceani TaxID=1653776 RepID=A0A9X2DU55_9BACI|nr:glycosyltransferase [Halalkalibacter oceani]MCM3715572.1 glycosyltransferase [Halalkalibacter oceani]
MMTANRHVLVLRSGYGKVYRYFEDSIVSALHNLALSSSLAPAHPLNTEALIESCRQEKPDLVLTLLGYQLDVRFFEWLQKNEIPLAVWLTEDPYMIDRSLQVLPYAKKAFTIDRQALSYYRKLGFTDTAFLPLATNPDVYKRGKQLDELASSICLVGYPYQARVDLIRFLADHLPLPITVVGEWKDISLPSHVNVVSRWVTPQDVALFYTSSRIVLNTYRSDSDPANDNSTGVKGTSLNNRTFEIASCRALQLTEYRTELHDFFSVDEIPSFRTKEELPDKIKQLLANPTDAEQAANKSYLAVTRHHTFENRLAKLLSYFPA